MQRIVYIVLATVLLSACSRGEQMRLQLERLEQDNRNDSVMQNDTLAESLTDYFDLHGSANERMRAYYILGRTYFDLGELPRALETYYKASDCADTTSADCDYKTLSRVHAQSAEVFRRQVQPRSQLRELNIAEICAWNSGDTLMAIECFAKKAFAYAYLHQPESVIKTKEKAANLFSQIGRRDRAAQTLGSTITSLIEVKNLDKAKQYIDEYEANSGFFDVKGIIAKRHLIYYYIKGSYYLAVNKVDSAEFLFRQLCKNGGGLNEQIAAYRGLLQVYSRKEVSDSIAKYANLSYELNDSAYSLSEMENIQKFQASYNYNHNKLLAEQQKRKADNAYLIITVIIALIVIMSLISIYFLSEYRKKEESKHAQYRHDIEELEKTQTELMQLRSTERLEAEMLIDAKNKVLQELQQKVATQQELLESRMASLEGRLDDSDIAKHLRQLLEKNPPQAASQVDFRDLRQFAIKAIPSFYSTLNTLNCSLRPIEYDVCLLIRFHFQPAEICKLTNRSDSYIANIRKGILMKVYGVKGSPKDLDQRILQIK